MRIGLDADGVCISEYSKLFSILTNLLSKSSDIEIFIISSRENSEKSRRETIQELKELEISYDRLILTDNKQQVIENNKIDLFIDNEIEQLQNINSDVCCLLIREKYNYCWEDDKFLGSEKTIRLI
jgi:uncharacterized HAD superfamily protein